MKKIPVTVLITEEQKTKLADRAEVLSVSQNAVIRLCLDRLDDLLTPDLLEIQAQLKAIRQRLSQVERCVEND